MTPRALATAALLMCLGGGRCALGLRHSLSAALDEADEAAAPETQPSRTTGWQTVAEVGGVESSTGAESRSAKAHAPHEMTLAAAAPAAPGSQLEVSALGASDDEDEFPMDKSPADFWARVDEASNSPTATASPSRAAQPSGVASTTVGDFQRAPVADIQVSALGASDDEDEFPMDKSPADFWARVDEASNSPTATASPSRAAQPWGVASTTVGDFRRAPVADIQARLVVANATVRGSAVRERPKTLQELGLASINGYTSEHCKWAYAVWKLPVHPDYHGVHAGGRGAWRALEYFMQVDPDGTWKLNRCESIEAAVRLFVDRGPRYNVTEPPKLFLWPCN